MTNAKQVAKPTLFTANKLKAIDLLAQGVNKSQVADMVGVDRSTIHAWLHQSEFSDAVAEHQSKLEALILDPTPRLQAIITAKQAWLDVVKSVVETAQDPSNPRQIRAAELIRDLVVTDDFSSFGPTEDEKVIQAYFVTNGWVTEAQSHGAE